MTTFNISGNVRLSLRGSFSLASHLHFSYPNLIELIATNIFSTIDDVEEFVYGFNLANETSTIQRLNISRNRGFTAIDFQVLVPMIDKMVDLDDLEVTGNSLYFVDQARQFMAGTGVSVSESNIENVDPEDDEEAINFESDGDDETVEVENPFIDEPAVVVENVVAVPGGVGEMVQEDIMPNPFIVEENVLGVEPGVVEETVQQGIMTNPFVVEATDSVEETVEPEASAVDLASAVRLSSEVEMASVVDLASGNDAVEADPAV
jgi:hypothetical protein